MLFGHSLVRIMIHACLVRMSSVGVHAPVRIASGMRHWNRIIKITGDVDYYCIIVVYCLSLVWYHVCIYSIICSDFLACWFILAWLSHVTIILYTCDYLCTLFSFILRTHWVVFLQLWTCMFKSRHVKRIGPFRRGLDFPWGAGRSAVHYSQFIFF